MISTEVEKSHISINYKYNCHNSSIKRYLKTNQHIIKLHICNINLALRSNSNKKTL